MYSTGRQNKVVQPLQSDLNTELFMKCLIHRIKTTDVFSHLVANDEYRLGHIRSKASAAQLPDRTCNGTFSFRVNRIDTAPHCIVLQRPTTE
jgi:hypothetical protein